MPMILAITGASGAGKTAVVQGLVAHSLPGVQFHFFDSVGVPTAAEMTEGFGSPEGWQGATTHAWIARLAEAVDGRQLDVLDGQMKPSVLVEAFAANHVSVGRILLLDCSPEVRQKRLTARGQPELASTQMMTWAAYLRGQADALHVPVLDTSALTLAAATGAVVQHIHCLLAPAV